MSGEATPAGWHANFPRIPIGGRRLLPASLPRSGYRFPHPDTVVAEGAATLGADFRPSTILKAYRSSYFPWPQEELEYLWFSPDPRAILPVGGLHVSRRFARLLRHCPFRVTTNMAFDSVLQCCAEGRSDGTWITPAYVAGYRELHRLGWAWSFDVWDAEGALAGGLYGIRMGRMFGAESMFHRATNASKVAMAALMQWAEDEQIELIDVQVVTPHTERMGAIEIDRSEYLARLKSALGA